MAARKKKKTTRKKAAARETLCVGSKVKNYIKANGLKCSGDLVPELSNRIHDMLDAAMARTTENRRSTVRPHDL